MDKRCLIVGCGFVGSALADALSGEGWAVTGVVRSDSSVRKYRGRSWGVIRGDAARREFWAEQTHTRGVIVFCASTGGRGPEAYREIHQRALGCALNWLPEDVSLVYTSSTSVYAQNDGSLVDEGSILDPRSQGSRIIVEAEKQVVARGGVVLRLGAIYGSGRGVLLERLKDGKAMIPEEDPKWLNMIFRDDVVSALMHALSGALEAGQVYNTVDDHPATYREVYTWLCEQTGLPLPPVGTVDYLSKRGKSNKRVLNRKLRDTGWRPGFPTFREGYGALL